MSEGSTTRRNVLYMGAGAAAATGLAGCMGDGGDGGGKTIEIAGSSTVFPLATAVSEAFEEEHPDVDVSISSTGSGGGFSNHFCPGNTDFNNASRPITEDERALCEENGVEPLELRVATDALTVIVNNEADWVDCVTVDELAQIWQPDGAERWSDVRDDWPDEEFELYGASSASGTFDYFTETVVGEEGAHRQDYQATERDRTIVQGVRGSEYAIGYFGYSYYYNNPDTVKALAVDGGDGCVEPSLDTASNGEYTPLSRPLFTYASKEALSQDHVADFARFFVEKSADEDLVAGEVGYVPNTEEQKQTQLDALESAIEDA